jgi:uncharacterized protein involved in tolerance to divalent cations
MRFTNVGGARKSSRSTTGCPHLTRKEETMSNEVKLQTTEDEQEEIQHLIDCHDGEFISIDQIQRLLVDVRLASALKRNAEDCKRVADAIVLEMEEVRKENEQLQADRDALRESLIACGRYAGGYLAETVSNEFLANVPEEVRLKIKTLTDNLNALLAALRNVKNYLDYRPVKTTKSGTYVKGPYGEKLAEVVFCGQEDLRILGMISAAIAQVEGH